MSGIQKDCRQKISTAADIKWHLRRENSRIFPSQWQAMTALMRRGTFL